MTNALQIMVVHHSCGYALWLYISVARRKDIDQTLPFPKKKKTAFKTCFQSRSMSWNLNTNTEGRNLSRVDFIVLTLRPDQCLFFTRNGLATFGRCAPFKEVLV